MNDKQIRQDVIDELEFEPSIDAANIGVLAKDGVITLTGHVPIYAQKLVAERAAWRVRGVKAVVQDIEVRYNGAPGSDEQIAKRALDILRWDGTVPEQVHVTMNHGWLTLSGEVDWQFQRTNAEKDLRGLAGVVGITNDITLKPVAQAAAVKGKILEAFKRNAEIEARQIDIAVRDGGTVVATGEVDNWVERQAVARAVWATPGVKAFQDKLTIG